MLENIKRWIKDIESDKQNKKNYGKYFLTLLKKFDYNAEKIFVIFIEAFTLLNSLHTANAFLINDERFRV